MLRFWILNKRSDDASGAPPPVVLLLFKEGNRLYSYHLKWDQIPPTKLYNLLPHLHRAEQTGTGTDLLYLHHLPHSCSALEVSASLHMSGKPLKEQQGDHSSTLSEPEPPVPQGRDLLLRVSTNKVTWLQTPRHPGY
ncbi:hypothetical protein DV515_00014575 [Chloebia gouldiae]|uniref:Uncharacterized protein n=1 Tax=Chloebia gouldiae TaxID=44316 RepID=A0A3L8RXW0_CHLGU|nr:hypothetical protein DV515_00014575 [Chloebia gouldiae]